MAEETKVFDLLSLRYVCIKFRASSFCLNQNQCHRTDFEGQFMVSDMNEILSFPRKFWYQNVDYVKLANFQMFKWDKV